MGTTEDHRRLNEFLKQKDARLDAPISKIFNFKDTQKAYEYLSARKYVGKAVIKIQ